MRIIDAMGQSINPELVRQTIKQLPPRTIARMHPTQKHMWESIGIAVSDVVVAEGHALDFDRIPPATMCSYTIELDLWFPQDRIRFEFDGRPIAGIINLAVPKPFAENASA